MIGCNFDERLIDGICSINSSSTDSIIDELYGSIRRHSNLTARPAFRLPDISNQDFEEYVRRCSDVGLKFNYTLNAPYVGSKRDLYNSKGSISELVKYLDDVGVSSVTVSNPIVANIVREISEHIGLEVSTIAHLESVTQIKAWNDRYGIDKVCGNLIKNRDIPFLRSVIRFCNTADIALNLIVNEFCGLGGVNTQETYYSHCIYRDSCFLFHSENLNESDDKLLGFYPMKYCIGSRVYPTYWLKAPFIRPEDIDKYYNNLGVDHYKITGRTGGTDYLLTIGEAYVQRSWEGNLLSLWKPLETIYSGDDELQHHHRWYFDNKKLNGYIDHWFDNDMNCANEECGDTCRYCDEFYESYLQEQHN